MIPPVVQHATAVIALAVFAIAAWHLVLADLPWPWRQDDAGDDAGRRRAELRRIQALAGATDQGGVAQLEQALRSSESPSVRSAAAAGLALASKALPGVHSSLLAALRYDTSAETRREAATALLLVHRPDVTVALLRAAIRDPDWVVRQHVVQLATHLNHARVIPTLISALVDDDHDLVRSAARRALASRPDAIPSLAALTSEPGIPADVLNDVILAVVDRADPIPDDVLRTMDAALKTIHADLRANAGSAATIPRKEFS